MGDRSRVLVILIAFQLCQLITGVSASERDDATVHDCIHERLHAGDIQLSGKREILSSVVSPQMYIGHPFDLRSLYRRRLLTDDTIYQNIRIFVDTSQVSLIDDLKRETLLNFLLPNAIDYLQKALKVIPVEGSLTLEPKTNLLDFHSYCGDAVIPVEHLSGGRGVDADFVLYVTTVDTDYATLAYSTACREDQYNRPIAGNINFNPIKLRTGLENREDQLATAVHEIMHTLGFSSTSYASFRSRQTGLKWGYDNVVRKNSRGRMEIVTPRVLEAVRVHFGCDSLTGAELENQGGFGTLGSHWEKRLFMNELMTASSTLNPIYSRVTLALFEDSGWYLPDYRYAQPLEWGAGAGCSFVEDKCIVNGHSKDPKFFCDAPAAMQCTFDRVAKGYCSITQQPNIPPEDQYFKSSPTVGGLDLADFCPIMAYYQIAGTNRTTDCRLSQNFPQRRDYYGEHFGIKSRCFTTNNLIRSGYKTRLNTACYIPRCNFENRTLSVLVGRNWLECPPEGGFVPAPPHFIGELECPSYEDECGGALAQCPNKCSGRGNCVGGKCFCVPGWQGQACDQEICPNRCYAARGQGRCVGSTKSWPPICKCNGGFFGVDCSGGSVIGSNSDLELESNEDQISESSRNVLWRPSTQASSIALLVVGALLIVGGVSGIGFVLVSIGRRKRYGPPSPAPLLPPDVPRSSTVLAV
mmetsp:Transcript_5939/g.9113  ORF Transcript_5939/g.9113 Transcript_5939/m.9113 type:complete len:695 (+) Transcript_5939:173-2257(+)|eukprot:CAMPEP_0184647382 /NCGR_PEP_ID=MMETSP0308-20130426/4291_1 /TAXON_ID=38269 /ORGANISM="Gloeochaete witrockiana, Strain SAG 46.84" /LENGTH=694 /DNA_ID=CAMNT_0027078275 /DNA_START=61 /DNA_END=2145 /DNA_ORIENTATION=-